MVAWSSMGKVCNGWCWHWKASEANEDVGGRDFRTKIVAKALDGQRYPSPLCEYMRVCDGERGSGPEGADDLCLVSLEALGLNLSINTVI